MSALFLMYHDLTDEDRPGRSSNDPYVLHPQTFATQMGAIASRALPVPRVTDWLGMARPRDAIVLTFDDGHISNHDVALPILLEHRLSATFFVTAGCIGRDQTMGWRQLRALQQAGMEIGSHTVTHRPPSTLDDMALRYELEESRRILEDGLGTPVTTISSPTGFFNPRMRALAREAGYQALCFGDVGIVGDSDDPFSLKRVAVKRGMTAKQFNAVLEFDPREIRRLRMRQVIRQSARNVFGPSTYGRLRQLLMRGIAM